MLDNVLLGYEKNQPIFLNEILEKTQLSRSRVNQLIKEDIDAGNLARFSEGVFYIPTQTILGQSVLDVRKVIEKKYIKNEESVYGIFSGIALQNYLAMTMQNPNVYELVTNNEATRCRRIEINGYKVILRKSRFKITKDNYKIYMLLELFNSINVNDDNVKKIVEYIKQNKITIGEIVQYLPYFPAKVSKIFNISGVFNAII